MSKSAWIFPATATVASPNSLSKTDSSGIGTDITYSYDYTGNPSYFLEGGWYSEYRGFGQVKETDAAGNYIKHYYYTTGTVNGEDAEKLTGREYKREYYNSSNTLLRTENFDWSWVVTSGQEAGDYIRIFEDATLSGSRGIAVYVDGNVFVADADADTGNDEIRIYDKEGDFKRSYGLDDYSTPCGVAVSLDGYIYVASTGDNKVKKYTLSGTYVDYWGSDRLTGPCGCRIS